MWFETYPLISSKMNDFLLFKEICLLMKVGKHLTGEGLNEIFELVSEMNKSGKRKHKLNEIKI